MMRTTCLILLAIVLSACASDTQVKRVRTEPEFDLRMAVIDVGGFKLQMTPRAVLAVIKAKGYRESASNRDTLEDLIANATTHDTRIEIFEFSYGESLDDRLMRETGIFRLDFNRGRVYAIGYELMNLTQEKLREVRERNEVLFDFVKERETKPLNTPRGGIDTSWIYKPNKLAFLRIDYVDREPKFTRSLPGKPIEAACDYSITVYDGNPNLMR